MKRFATIMVGLTFGLAFTSASLASDATKIGFITVSAGEPYATIEAAAKQRAKRDGGIDLIVAEGAAGTDSQGQIALIDSMIAQGVAAIALTPVDNTVSAALDKAVAAGIKVVLIDNDIPGWSGKTAFVGTNNLKGGIHAGRWLHDHTRDGDKFGILESTPGVPALDDRVTGMLQGLGDRKLDIVGTEATTCDQAAGSKAVADLLAAHPDLSGIFSACGPLAVGAIQSLKSAKVDFGKFTLVGFDICCGEREALVAGEEDATIAHDPDRLGDVGVATAAKAARGEAVDANVDTGNILVTGENANDVN